MKKLCCVLATRLRPVLLERFIAQTLATFTNENTVLLIAADADDKATIAALEEPAKLPRVIVSIKDREDTIAAKFNRALAAVVDADVYVPMMDKSPFIDMGTDSAILEAASQFPDGIGVVYNFPGQSGITGFQAVTHKLVDLMGHIFPEVFPYWFTDPWLNDIAKQVNRIAFAPVEISHYISEAPTQELREPAFWTNVYDSLYLLRRQMAHRTIDATCDEAWRKKLHKSWYPMLEAQSRRNINGTRAIKAQEPPQDDRYRRVKSAAIKLVQEQLPLIEADQKGRAV